MTVTVLGNATSSGSPLESRLGRQVPEYYQSAVREVERTSQTTRDALTGGTVAAWVTATRAAFKACVPDLPSVSLSAVVEDTIIETGYKIHNVRFQSRLGFWVTGNLYVPTAAETTPAPGVLVCCGHNTLGVYGYRELPQALAKLGYVALGMNAIGMSDRIMIPSSPVEEHRKIGPQLALIGESMAQMQRWDTKVALDYLASRSEVDTNDLGVCGHSGGGTQAAWLAATDSRITMAAVSGFITRNSRNIESEMIGDPDHEQYPPTMLSRGLVLDDIISCCDFPTLIAANSLDYFQSRGSEVVNTNRTAVFDLLGKVAADRPYYVGTTYHAIYKAIREQFYSVFKHATSGSHSTTEPTIDSRAEADLVVAPTGSVNDIAGARSTADVIGDEADTLATARGNPTGAALVTAVETVLRLPGTSRASPPDFSVWESKLGITTYPTDYSCVYGVETEPAVVSGGEITRKAVYAAATMLSANRLPVEPPTVTGGTRLILYLSHESADQELDSASPREPLIDTLIAAEPSVAFVAMDPRGWGQGKPSSNSTTPTQLFNGHAEMLDEPLLGRYVWDVQRVIDMFASYGYTDIHLAGKGNGAIVAALVGLLESAVTQVTLINSLATFDSIARAVPNTYNWREDLLASGLLIEFDLDDVYADLTTNKSLSNTSQWPIWHI